MSEHTPPPTLPPLATLLTGQLAYHTRVLLRTPRAVIGGMLLPILLLLLRNDGVHTTQAERIQLVAGLAAFGALSTAYITHAANLVAARQDGVLKRWRITPLPAWCYFTGRIAATTLLAATRGALTALVGDSVYDLHIGLAAVPGLVVVLMLGAATWASIGIAASALIPTVEAAWPLLGATYLPIVILSGSFGAVGNELRWLATVIGYLPVRPIIDSTTRLLDAGAGAPVVSLRDLATLAAWTVAGMLFCGRYFAWTPRPPGRGRTSRASRPGGDARSSGVSWRASTRA